MQRTSRLVATLLAGLAAGAGSSGCLFSAPRHTGPKTTHFDGDRFSNQGEATEKSFFDFLAWMLNRNRGPWKGARRAEPGPPPPRRVGPGELRVTFVNHATVLIQIDGLNVLTDPIWSERASPVSWVGPRRVRPPGLRFEDLPPIDLVLVSHNHYDHLDLPTLERLAREHDPVVLTGLGNRKLLVRRRIDRVHVGRGVRITFVPARHFSSRGLADRNASLWGGFVLQAGNTTVYFAGDTGFGPHFAQVRQAFGPVTLALLPIGAYRPRWFMSPVHISPAEAVRAHRILDAGLSMAIHFGTFPLGDDGETEPAEAIHQALRTAGLPRDIFWIPAFGEGREIAEPRPADQG